MRYGVKVAFQIRIQYPVFATPQQLVHSAQRVFTPFSRPKTVALSREFTLEDRFDDLEHCSLYDPVSDRRNPERSLLLAPRLGYPYSFNCLWLVLACS